MPFKAGYTRRQPLQNVFPSKQMRIKNPQPHHELQILGIEKLLEN